MGNRLSANQSGGKLNNGPFELTILFGPTQFRWTQMPGLQKICFSLLLAWTPTLSLAAASDDLFRETVAPILATHCAGCHNEQESKGDFSVHDATSFFAAGVVERGASDASHLIDLVSANDSGKPEMPKSGSALSSEQVQAIRTWIDNGATWPAGFEVLPNRQVDFDWWSFRDLRRPDVPSFHSTEDRDWVRTPVDAFILDQLRRHGLSPNRAAGRAALIRRLSYDLTGLPPAPDEIESFLNDSSPAAYEKLVERYLASPRYGEHWARHWLDIVKYADTCGYDKDKLRQNAWPYRDYVIRSFNSDKPYRQFVEEQIAGDELYPDSPDGILGLGFIAAGPWDFIGHVEVPESKIDGQVARNLDRDDMVSNTLNTFCSVTIQCARCHDHKFDPFSQEHYYGLQAVFAAVDRADRVYDSDPAVNQQRRILQTSISEIERELKQLAADMIAAGGPELKQLDDQIEQANRTTKRAEFGYHSQIADHPESEKWVEVEFDHPSPVTKIVLRPCHDEFNQIGAGFGFPVRFRIEADGKLIHAATSEDFANPGLQPVSIPVQLTASKIRLIATRLAPRQNDYIFALAELQVLDENLDNVAAGAQVNALDSIEAPVRWRKSNLVDGIWFEDGGQDLKQLENQRDALIEKSVGAEVVQRQASLKERLAACQSKIEKLPAGKLVYAAASEFAEQGNFKPTRGNPRKSGCCSGAT